jgi:hypothetical protein
MKLSEDLKDLLVKEIDFAVKKMEETKEPMELLYYFSAIPGAINRIFNIEYDPDLVYAHFILKAAHENFIQRLKAFTHGGDTSFMISDDQFERLVSLSKDLLRNFRKDKDIDDVLKKLTILLYSTSGNGNYLMQKGWLKI